MPEEKKRGRPKKADEPTEAKASRLLRGEVDDDLWKEVIASYTHPKYPPILQGLRDAGHYFTISPAVAEKLTLGGAKIVQMIGTNFWGEERVYVFEKDEDVITKALR